MFLECYYNGMRTYIFVFRDIFRDCDYRATVRSKDLRNSYDFIEKVLFDRDLRLVDRYCVCTGPDFSGLRRMRFKGLAFEYFRPIDVVPYPVFERLDVRTKVVPDEHRT